MEEMEEVFDTRDIEKFGMYRDCYGRDIVCFEKTEDFAFLSHCTVAESDGSIDVSCDLNKVFVIDLNKPDFTPLESVQLVGEAVE